MWQALRGERLVQQLLRPIPPEAVSGFVASGARADFLLPLALQSIGPWRKAGAGGAPLEADRAFGELVDSFAKPSQGGALDLRRGAAADPEAPPTFVLALPPIDGELAAERGWVYEWLGLDKARSEFLMVVSSRERAPDRIAVTSRSLNALLGYLSAGVKVAESDLAEGRAVRRSRRDPPPLRVRSAAEPPAAGEAALAVRHRER